MIGSGYGKVDVGWGSWVKGGKIILPISEPFEVMFCIRRDTLSDLGKWSHEQKI